MSGNEVSEITSALSANIPIILGAVAAFILIGLLVKGYLKAPPDTVYIISGIKKARYVVSKAAFMIPFFERKDELSLKLIPINVKTSNPIPTADYINISVDANVNIKIGNNDSLLALAAENFLNKPTDYISKVAQEVLEGNIREIVGRMKLEAMVSDREQFNKFVKENSAPDLAGMGLEIVSFNVQNFTDTNEVITNLGIDNVEQIRKKAAIAKAEAKRDIDVANAKADKEANDAKVASDMEIAEKQNSLEIKKAELKMAADKQKAIADATYKIQEQEERRKVEISTVNADIGRQEREAELKEKEVAVKERELEASVNKTADAKLYEEKRRVDAERYSREQEAEARKIQADADRYIKEQEAAGIRAVGEAEASAIKAKGLADAEAMEKRADAYSKYNQAAVASMLIEVLPEIAGKVAEPLTQIDKISIIGGNDGGGSIDSVAGNVPVVMAKVFKSVEEATGINLSNIVNAQSYDAKVNRNVTVKGLEGISVKAEEEVTEPETAEPDVDAEDTEE